MFAPVADMSSLISRRYPQSLFHQAADAAPGSNTATSARITQNLTFCIYIRFRPRRHDRRKQPADGGAMSVGGQVYRLMTTRVVRSSARPSRRPLGSTTVTPRNQ